MKFAVLDRTFSPHLTAPVTHDRWMQVNHRLDGCLEAQQVRWLHSLISLTGDRALCLFQVPYTETVRAACRTAQMPFQTVWQAELWCDQEPSSVPQGGALVVAEVDYAPPMTRARYEASKPHLAGCFHELNVHHAWSMVTLDGTHSVCVFVASSAEAVRSLYRKVRMPFERVWKATLIQP